VRLSPEEVMARAAQVRARARARAG